MGQVKSKGKIKHQNGKGNVNLQAVKEHEELERTLDVLMKRASLALKTITRSIKSMVIGMTKQKVTGGENSIGLDSVAEKEMLDGDILLKDQISRLAI